MLANTRAFLFILYAVILAFAINVVGRYPGMASFDSDYQYGEAVLRHYTDWHPPIMALLMTVLRLMADGNGPLFLLHVFLYWLSFAFIAGGLTKTGRSRAAWAVFIIALFPIFLTQNIQLVKDTGMGVSFLTAFGIFFYYQVQGKQLPILPAGTIAALLFYGIMVRVNGIFAAAPLLIYMLYPRLRLRLVRLGLVCIVIIVATIPLCGIINHNMLHAVPTYPLRSLQVFDVTGIAFFSGDTSVLGSTLHATREKVEECYSPHTWDSVAPGSLCHNFWDALAILPGVPDVSTIEGRMWYENPPNSQLTAIWVAAILKHPLAYFQHRLMYFNSSIGFIVQRHHADRFVLNHIAYGHDVHAGPPINRFFDFIKFNPLTTPIFALMLGFVLLASAHRKPPIHLMPESQFNAVFYLIVSGLTYGFQFLITGVSSDLRYQFWTVLAIFTSAAICVPQQWKFQRSLSHTERTAAGLLLVTFTISLSARIILGDALFPDK